ncbi:MAG: hypothetical protein HUU60_04035 [Armatimonadetes bacterium]|nr:hypothetical protein [Armatimonadota bacterium]
MSLPIVRMCLIAVMIGSTFSLAFCQRATMDWWRRFDGPFHGSDILTDMKLHPSGIVLTGRWSGNPAGSDTGTILYRPNGQIAWIAHKPPLNCCLNHAIALDVDDAGRVLVAGYQDNADRVSDLFIVSYDAEGREEWRTVYDSPYGFHEVVHDLALDSSGAVYVAGEAYYDIEGRRAWLVAKFDRQGRLLWEQIRLPSPPVTISSNAMQLAVDKVRDRVYVSGSFTNGFDDEFVAQGRTLSVVRIDPSNGSIIWENRDAGPTGRGGSPFRIAVAKDGSLYGWTSIFVIYNNGWQRTGGLATRWTAEGDTVFYRLDQSEDPRRHSIGYPNATLSEQGSLVLGGFHRNDTLVSKIDQSGVFSWRNIYYFSTSDNYCQSVATDIAGNAFIAINVHSDEEIDAGAARLYPDGRLAWYRVYRGAARNVDNANQVVIDGKGGVYIGGSTVHQWSSISDWLLIRYCDPIADADGNGLVDMRDLEIVLETFGTADARADLNQDGIVDDLDLSWALAFFGSHCVPEN